MDDLFTIIDARAADKPDAPALIDGQTGHVRSYGDLALRIDHVAGQLAAVGVVPGSNILSLTVRSRDLVELVLAASRLGASILPFIGAPYCGGLVRARAMLRPSHVFHDSIGEGFRRDNLEGEIWMPLPELHGATPVPLPPRVPDGTGTLYYNASTGTTGVSKLVRATHRQVVLNSEAVAQAFSLGPTHIHLSCFRHHCHELFARALVSGGAAVILPAAEDPFEVIRALRQFRVSHLMAGPRAVSVLESALEISPGDFSLQVVESGGGDLWEGLRRSVAALTGAEVLRVWGSTETTGVVFAQRPGESAERHTIGSPLPGYEVSLVDERGEPVPRGERGELIVVGEGVAREYLEPNDRLVSNRFQSGDIMRTDNDNDFYYVGRCASTFKVAGVRVNAEDIERAIQQTGCVREVMVLPFPSRSLGHVPVALVVLKPGRRLQNIDMDVVANALHTDLEYPAAFIAVEEIPLTVGGKPDRKAGAALLPGHLPGHARRWRFKPMKWVRHYWRELRGSNVLMRAARHPRRYFTLARRDRFKRHNAGSDFTDSGQGGPPPQAPPTRR